MTVPEDGPKLCVIEGDGIGREVIPVAVEVLRAVIPELTVEYASAGWHSFRAHGTSVPDETLQAVRRCGAGLFGATASPGRTVPGYRSAILRLRQELDLYANIRPVIALPAHSTRPGVDLVVVRENTEDLYAGRELRTADTAVAERVVTAAASRRVASTALRFAATRGAKKLTIVHKANVLPVTDGLFRECVREVVAGYSGRLDVEDCYVDVASYRMVASPESFDMIVTTNLFGDILSDAAAHWCGGLGTAPSLNQGDTVSVAEPVHGSAPDIAGTGAADPTAAIRGAALLVAHVWNRPAAARRIEAAVVAAAKTGAHNRLPVLQSVRAAVLSYLEASMATDTSTSLE